jgi:hypothetical protein
MISLEGCPHTLAGYVKALAAQQCAFRAQFGRHVVLPDRRELVPGGEGAPFRLGRPRAVRPGRPAPGRGVRPAGCPACLS